jgi:hypothetical protein
MNETESKQISLTPHSGCSFLVNGKKAYMLNDPILNYDKQGYVGQALLFDSRIETVDLFWNFTPAFARALTTYFSADERDEIVTAIVEDIEGAAEWYEPQIIAYVTPPVAVSDCYTDAGAKHYYKGGGMK